MNELLFALLTLLTQKLVVEDKVLTSVLMIDSFSIGSLLKQQHMPTLVLSSAGEFHEQGPMANTAQEYFQLRLTLISRSTIIQAYQTNAISGPTPTATNIYKQTDKIRDILYQNKQLIPSVFEMSPLYRVIDLATVGQESNGQYAGREISIQYTNLEYYTGMINDQPSLIIPNLQEPIQF